MLLGAALQFYVAIQGYARDALLSIFTSIPNAEHLTAPDPPPDAPPPAHSLSTERKLPVQSVTTPAKCASKSDVDAKAALQNVLPAGGTLPDIDDALYHPSDVRLSIGSVRCPMDEEPPPCRPSLDGASAVPEHRAALLAEPKSPSSCHDKSDVSCTHSESSPFREASDELMQNCMAELREEISALRARCGAAEDAHRKSLSESHCLRERCDGMESALTAATEEKCVLEEKCRMLQRMHDCKIAQHERLVDEVMLKNKELCALQGQMTDAKDTYESATQIVVGELRDVLEQHRHIEREHEIVKRRAKMAEIVTAKHAASMQIAAGRMVVGNVKAMRAFRRCRNKI